MDITAFIRILQLSQQLGLGAVLIEQPPGPAAAPVPAVCQLDLQAVLPLLQQGGHVVGLVLHSFAVISVAGGQHEIPHPAAVQLCLVQPTGGDIEPRPSRAGNGKTLAKAVHRVTAALIHIIVPRDPPGPPGLPLRQACLKGGAAPLARDVVFIP